MSSTIGRAGRSHVQYDHTGTPFFSEESKRDMRVENARATRWVELDRDKIGLHGRHVADPDGQLYVRMNAPVFDPDCKPSLNELAVHAWFVGDDGDVVCLQRASNPSTLADLEAQRAKRDAKAAEDRDKRRAELRALKRSPLTVADLEGVRELPGLRAAVALLDEWGCVSFDQGELTLRLPVGGNRTPELLQAARVAWFCRELVEAHVAAKQPLSSLPAGVVLADGSVEA